MKKKADICRSAWPPVRLPSNFGCTLHTLHDVHWLPPGRKMHSHGAPDPDGLYRTGAAKLSALSRDVIARTAGRCSRRVGGVCAWGHRSNRRDDRHPVSWTGRGCEVALPDCAVTDAEGVRKVSVASVEERCI